MTATSLFRVFILVVGALAALCGCDRGSYRRSWDGDWSYGDAVFVPRDPTTFKALSQHFGRDEHQGYYRGSAVGGSDGRTFESLSENEARDEHAVYYCDTYRKAQEYWAYQHLSIVAIDGADAASYRVLAHGYARDRSRAYDRGSFFAVRDVASFEPLSEWFARDAQRGYFKRAEVPASHGPSFVLMREDDPGYVRDRNHGWYGHIEVNEPNRSARPVLRSLQGVDLGTLRALGRGYAADAKQVWYQGLPLAQSDAASFSVQGEMMGESDATDIAHGQVRSWQRGKMVVHSASVTSFSPQQQSK